jgi:hypothetical protein
MAASAILKLTGKTNWALVVRPWAARFLITGNFKRWSSRSCPMRPFEAMPLSSVRDTFEVARWQQLKQSVWITHRVEGAGIRARTVGRPQSRVCLHGVIWQSNLQRIDCKIHETVTSQCVSESTFAATPRVCKQENQLRGSTKYGGSSWMSLLARCFFAVTKYAIKFGDKGCQFVRVHFLTGLFGEALPIARLVRGHRAPLSCSPGFLKLLWILSQY